MITHHECAKDEKKKKKTTGRLDYGHYLGKTGKLDDTPPALSSR